MKKPIWKFMRILLDIAGERNTAATVLHKIILVALCLALTGCAGTAGSVPVSGRLPGYLTADSVPNGEIFIPPPPAAGSAAQALDDDISRKSLALRGSPRWALAAKDADLNFPEAAGVFSCALNAPVTEEETPHLIRLLRRVLSDAGLPVSRAKKKFARERPFAVNREPVCTTDGEPVPKKNGSYPSAHGAVGWAWALILSEISPERADELLARGRAFGQSRVICNFHWESDVIEGCFLGAAIVARLHANAEFRADLETARSEIAAVRAKGLKPIRDCQAEAAALSEYPPRAPWPANR